jgi:sialic acid synthase SpsE
MNPMMNDILILADLCSNHAMSVDLAETMLDECAVLELVPKIQLFNQHTWPDAFMDLLRERKFIASVFKPDDIDRIMPYEPIALKIASTESLHAKLIDACLDTRLPLIISTGGMIPAELFTLVMYTLSNHIAPDITYMHCIATYPTCPDELNIATIRYFAQRYNKVGLSIHTDNSTHAHNASILALAFGARTFEYHIKPIDTHTSRIPEAHSALSSTQIYHIKVNLVSALEQIGNSCLNIKRPDRADILEYRKRWNTEWPTVGELPDATKQGAHINESS